MQALILQAEGYDGSEGKRALERTGFSVVATTSAREAMAHLRSANFDLIVVDLRGPLGVTFDFLRSVRMLRSDQPIAAIGPRRRVKGIAEALAGLSFQAFNWERLSEAAKAEVMATEGRSERAMTRLLSALMDAASALRSEQDVSNACSRILEHMAGSVLAQEAHLWLIESGGGGLEHLASHPAEAVPSLKKIGWGQGLVGRVAEKGAAIIVPAPGVDTDLVVELQAQRASGMAGVPLMAAGRMRGVLLLTRLPRNPPFEERDLARLGQGLPLVAQIAEVLHSRAEMRRLEAGLAETKDVVERRHREIEALTRMFQENMLATQKLESTATAHRTAYRSLLNLWVQAVEGRRSSGVEVNLAEKAERFTKLVQALGLEGENLDELCLLYDIGLMEVPEGLLREAEPLNEEGRQYIRQHPLRGEELLQSMGFPPEWQKAVRHHHENLDGSGYPDGLAGAAIPLLARALRVVDSYQAMISPRPHRPALSSSLALEELRRGVGSYYDPKVVAAFAQVLGVAAEPGAEAGAAVISHELKSPLTYLIGFSELLAREKNLSPEVAKRLSDMHDEAVYMSQLLEKVGEVSRLEREGGEFSRQPVALAGLIEAAVKRAQAGTARHTIETEVAAPLPLLLGDPDRLSQVLNNLLENAIKYSPQGGLVTVRAAALPEGVKVCVEDQGIGIPADGRDRLFEKYFRADTPEVRATRGTGLGLHLCKRIVEGHGGKIWVESREGQGATLCFSIPTLTQA